MTTPHTPRRLAATAALALGLLAAPTAAVAATGYATPRPTPPPPVGADDLAVPMPLLSVELDDADEGDGQVPGRLVLSAPLDDALSVSVGVRFPGVDDQDVVCPTVDWSAGGGGCTWALDVDVPAGATEAPFALDVVWDGWDEDAELIGAEIESVHPGNRVRVGPEAAAVLYDGDGLTLELVDDAPEAIEGDPGTDGTLDLVVTADQALPHPVTFRVHTVIVGFGATPGADYTPVDTVVELPAGETSIAVGVPLVGDQLDESPHEIFMAHVGEPSHGEIALSGGTAVPRIMDDDGPRAVFETPGGYQSPSRSARSAAFTA